MAHGRFGFDELDLRVGMPEFEQLGLQKGMIARIVHQADMIFELRVEADRKHVVFEGDGVRFKKVGAGKLAHAADSLDEPIP